MSAYGLLIIKKYILKNELFALSLFLNIFCVNFQEYI